MTMNGLRCLVVQSQFIVAISVVISRKSEYEVFPMVIRDKLYYENRIQLLTNRSKDNGKIVKKLMRKLRNIEDKEGGR